MKRVLIILCMVMMLCLVGCSCGNGSDGSSKAGNTDKRQENAEEGEGGGNKYDSKDLEGRDIISILVNEDEYFYKNKEIEYEDIIDMVKDSKDEVAVEISDKDATRKAYEKLVDELEELEIPIIEETVE